MTITLVALALLPFAAYKLTETIKIGIPWALHPLTKAVLPLVFTAGLVFLVDIDWQSRVLLALGSAGLAGAYQKIVRYFSHAADERAVTAIMETQQPRRRRV